MPNTPPPPYHVVIFSSRRTAGDAEGYGATAARMGELAAAQPGFLGMESARSPDGFGITVCYWTDEASIAAWKAEMEHRAAQEAGLARWYERFELRVGVVHRARTFTRG